MGSYYFSDFVLFHRIFGLEKMVSIEIDQKNKARFLFNKPFDCIEMAWGSTTDQLPQIELFTERPVICWLDYYDYLTDPIIGDVLTVLRRVQAGSALLVTLKSRSLDTVQKLKDFEKNLSEENRDLSDQKLLQKGAKGIANFMTEVIAEAMAPVMLDMNEGRKPEDKLQLRQIVKMFYRDGDPMVTIGWLILSPAQTLKLDLSPSALDAPGIALEGSDLKEVSAPVLTFREIAHLKAMLPNGMAAPEFETKIGPVPLQDAQLFASLYRYFPNFADVEE